MQLLNNILRPRRVQPEQLEFLLEFSLKIDGGRFISTADALEYENLMTKCLKNTVSRKEIAWMYRMIAQYQHRVDAANMSNMIIAANHIHAAERGSSRFSRDDIQLAKRTLYACTHAVDITPADFHRICTLYDYRFDSPAGPVDSADDTAS